LKQQNKQNIMNTIRTSILRSGALAPPTVPRFTLSRSTVRGLLGLATLVLAHTTPAQTWQTVDDYQYVAGLTAENFGLTVAPSGVVFASGFASDGSTCHGLVMASTDRGITWSAPIDDFVYPGSATRDDGGIVADSAGNLYVAGRYYFSSGPSYRFVRRSTDGGATWFTVDTVTINGGYASPLAAGAITADVVGNVYVTEPIFGTWTVRKGTGGTSFSTVDTFQPSGSQAQAVFAHPTAGVFAVGSGTVVNKNSSSQAWMVRRSLDGGAILHAVKIMTLLLTPSGLGARGMSHDLPLLYRQRSGRAGS
jgi:hypothetical protein